MMTVPLLNCFTSGVPSCALSTYSILSHQTVPLRLKFNNNSFGIELLIMDPAIINELSCNRVIEERIESFT